ncbi:MAG: hypothetical protein ABFS42_03265 [Candidatus Krumholzibacteriota bacterium]
MESDARTVPWETVRRLALEAGVFPPVYQPVTEGELADLLDGAYDQAMSGEAAAFGDEEELARLEFWRDRYRRGGGGRTWYGCDCKVHPPQMRVSGRAATGFTDLGTPFAREAGLGWAPGWNATFEPVLDFSAGPWWISVTGRLTGQVAPAGIDFSGPGGDRSALAWPGWSIPTGRSQVRDARLRNGRWTVDAPRAVAGVTWGRWSFSGGWAPRTTGPGLTGALALDRSGASFPAVTARRTRPFDWGSAFWNFFAPDDLLLMTGRLTERLVRYRGRVDIYHEKADQPWFFQWLIGWRFTSWFRTTFTHTAMAVPREGSLWGDLLQINFPIKGTTWSETTHGPVTDRIFSAQLEARWRHAPWPLLPAAAGRVFWDYAGTDFLPSGPGGWVPQISIPSSVIGVELVDPAWDLGLEYSELLHETVLWYSNSGFPTEGYSHDGWLLGHALGGSGESFTGLVRVRPPGRGLEPALRVRHATWGMVGVTPGSGRLTTVALSVKNLPSGPPWGPAADLAPPSPLLWEITAEWNRENAAPGDGSDAEKDWWRVYFKVGI